MAAKNTTTTNLSPNVASALCYVPFVGWIAAIVLFIVEKSSVVKWNAVQALLLMAVLWALGFVLGITVILVVLVPVVWVAGLIIQLVVAVKTYQGETVRLPLIGDWTNKVVKKV
jgi:uncharacterized membrane protein